MQPSARTVGGRVALCVIGLIGVQLISVLIAAAEPTALVVRSPAFREGAAIPRRYTCEGSDRSPPLAWSGAPAGTGAFALVVEDPDAPGGAFIHWVVFNLPADSTGLPEAVTRAKSLPGGGGQGLNNFGRIGYAGPCPPPGRLHHYHFRLFALDRPLTLGREATGAALSEALRGHIKASADLVGVFRR